MPQRTDNQLAALFGGRVLDPDLNPQLSLRQLRDEYLGEGEQIIFVPFADQPCMTPLNEGAHESYRAFLQESHIPYLWAAFPKNSGNVQEFATRLRGDIAGRDWRWKLKSFMVRHFGPWDPMYA